MAKLHFDPQALPIDSYAGEPPVDPARLTPHGLRAHFNSPRNWEPETTDEHRQRAATGAVRAASVLMPIVDRPSGLTLLLTRRTEHLKSHSGQISLPGGRAEEHDRDAIDTALRETEEEVGLSRRHIEVIGHLPEYCTGSGYCVTPVVGLVHPPFELQADPNEVAEMFEVPLAFLMNGDNHQRRTALLANGAGTRSFYAMPWEGYFIWGATAGMLRNLFHYLRA